jgi:hypothetical protein
LAATWIKPRRVRNGKNAVQTISACIWYIINPDKTDNGRLVSCHQCDPATAIEEFLLSKQQYEHITGREAPPRDVLLYHMRQSFKPGEITPEKANRIGHELARRFTRDNHAFIVATHVDQAHIHTHVIFNSTAVDCERKFRNFIGSSFALRRLSDHICLENGLSIIKNPQPRQGRHYGTWLGADRPTNFTRRIKGAIDAALEQRPANFDAFLIALDALGIEAARRGRALRFRCRVDGNLPAQQNFTRCDSLKGDYTEEAIRDRIAGTAHKAVGFSSPPRVSSRAPGLLIDIQAKLQQANSPGYERWAKVHNLKEMAKTLIFLQEQGLDDYAALEERTAAATVAFHDTSGRIKAAEARMEEINSLQKHIGNYNRTRDIYRQYKAARFSKTFRAKHEGAILLHQAAKKAFDELGTPKLPTIKALQTEYAKLVTEKKRLYRDYRQARESMRSLQRARQNADQLLRTVPDPQEQGRQR